ncbi:hypothetical protein BK133_12545 [Paenibacillus sp. FSL H8-0548]|uniref:hypothetical protein n=1 Tax=Paenibacillus sp. FSL H8-0548 TaxID=1920422 RepID=UPI00096C7C6D|nr:hypothetical protein [Paenibacillus sp. FSL H8-0548]OMF34613.1 hypothetical protein BK133_12545 [Paenibacillus sp. FSL H8-0548]
MGMLSTIDYSIFKAYNEELSKIMKHTIEYDTSEQKDELLVTYRSSVFNKSQSNLLFKIVIFDKANSFVDQHTLMLITGPTLKIQDIIINPQQQGFGTQVIEEFKRYFSNLRVPRVILKSEDTEVASFWEKQGFIYEIDNHAVSPYSPRMHYDF